MPRSAKKSVSFVNAAFMTSGAPATIGHDAVSISFCEARHHVRDAGEEDVLQLLAALFRSWWWNSRLWMCACATFDG